MSPEVSGPPADDQAARTDVPDAQMKIARHFAADTSSRWGQGDRTAVAALLAAYDRRAQEIEQAAYDRDTALARAAAAEAARAEKIWTADEMRQIAGGFIEERNRAEALSSLLRGMARRVRHHRRWARTASTQGLAANHQASNLLKRLGNAVGVRHAGYRGQFESEADVQAVIAAALQQRADLATTRARVAAVRALHSRDEQMAAFGRQQCAGCATHFTHTPWPCKTIKALDGPAPTTEGLDHG